MVVRDHYALRVQEEAVVSVLASSVEELFTVPIHVVATPRG
jgi:hypothetical protein